MSFNYRLHSLAVEDYREAYSWYEDQQKGLGERFIKAVRNKISAIAEYPEANGSRARKDYREVKIDFFPYVIVYKIYKRKKEIYISAIHHTKKNPKTKFRK